MTEKNVATAIEAGLSNVGLSIDGDEKIHNTIRNHPESYRKVLEAMDNCNRLGMPIGVVTHINKLNLPLIDDLAQLMVDNNVKIWQIQLGFDAGNLSDHPELLLDPSDLKEIIPKTAQLMVELKEKGVRITPGDDMGYYTEEEQTLRSDNHPIDFWTGCQAGIQVIGIEANGNIKGCLSMQTDKFVEGNIREEPLRDIWFKEGNFAYTRNFKPENLGGFCGECKYIEFCRGGCSWKAYLHGQGTGKFANRYCLYQVYVLEEREAEQAAAEKAS
jgi:radical SAM protein with 4Fe4S-binding SPASM domain